VESQHKPTWHECCTPQ